MSYSNDFLQNKYDNMCMWFPCNFSFICTFSIMQSILLANLQCQIRSYKNTPIRTCDSSKSHDFSTRKIQNFPKISNSITLKKTTDTIDTIFNIIAVWIRHSATSFVMVRRTRREPMATFKDSRDHQTGRFYSPLSVGGKTLTPVAQILKNRKNRAENDGNIDEFLRKVVFACPRAVSVATPSLYGFGSRPKLLRWPFFV